MADISNWVVVAATLIGPILAVQTQKWIERSRARRDAMEWVCRTLMATRRARLSGDHVRALNMIDLAFYGSVIFGKQWQRPSEKKVTTAWKVYLDKLCIDLTDATDAQVESVITQRNTAFLDLLAAVCNAMSYSFDSVQLEKAAYSPIAHGELENKQRLLLEETISVLQGDKPIKMEVVSFPVNPQAAHAHQVMVAQVVAATVDGAIKVRAAVD